ncbi:MAG: hypothetical protein H6669_17095 [Ardenticatenaceae bacterium]|nr:hypothetical protein [Ardenticatenaceae bacterium]
MSGDLLQTKLYVPRLRPSLVPRPHLITRLNRGLHRKLTLISAPAGFGKTTLVSEWIADGERPFDWLSLDERDSDLTRFLTYLIAALQTHTPSLGKKALAMLESPDPPPAESILTILLNEIAAIPEEFALVLDDYHILDAAPPIDQALTFLLEHLPPQMHLVITTREDPPLPLSRLRVRGLLTELRVADLRFTVEETAVFLNKVTGLEFSTNEIAALEKRTEGWIAGLQLAAISMQGRADVPGFIKAFAGDDRHRRITSLMRSCSDSPGTSGATCARHHLDRLSGRCVTVTNQEEGDKLLETLERSSLFVIPLDDKRQWYRYHHLFGDVLRAHLMKRTGRDHRGALHQQASSWYEEPRFNSRCRPSRLLPAADLVQAARILSRPGQKWTESSGRQISAELGQNAARR